MLTMKRLPYVLGVIIVLFAIIYAICHYSNNWYDDCVVSTITVKQGDTLYDYWVATDNGTSYSQWLSDIKTLNNMTTSNIYVGQSLQLYIKED